MYERLTREWDAQTPEEEKNLGWAQTRLGGLYASLGKYQMAIDFYEQSLEIMRQIGDVGGEAASLGSLGNAYKSLGQYPRAIDFYEQSLEMMRQIGDVGGEAISLFNKGNALAKLDQHWEALESYQSAKQIFEELKLAHEVEKCNTAIAERNKIIAATPRPPHRRRTPRRTGLVRQISAHGFHPSSHPTALCQNSRMGLFLRRVGDRIDYLVVVDIGGLGFGNFKSLLVRFKERSTHPTVYGDCWRFRCLWVVRF